MLGFTRWPTPWLVTSMLLVTSGCDESTKDNGDTDTDPLDTDTDVGPPPARRDVSLRTRAAFRTEPANCGQSYENIGTLNSRVRLVDFKVYVHNVVLISDRGTEHPVDLAVDPPYSDGAVALLDFATDVGTCEGGDGTRTRIIGTADDVPVSSVRFTLGVPRSLSTSPFDGAEPPLNVESMYLNQTFGRLHGRVAVQADAVPDPFVSIVHTTGCIAPETCTSENILEVEIEGFTDLDTSEIVFDLAEVLVRNDMNEPGCRGLPQDPNCRTFFVSWGLGATGPAWIYAD